MAGCESKGNPTKLKKKNIKKCGKREKRLAACDFTCQIDGGWSDYGDWSACSAECGGGEQTRERQCNNPTPQKGGAECEGESSETRSCNEQACPVDGGWGDWSDWSECSAECDGGTQTRSKKCNNPAPANGGADCEGEDTATRECNTQSCVGKCPSTHPYVYYNGEYCCQTNKEKVHEPQGEKCDGSEIQKDSLCCENDGYAACPADSGLCEGATVDGGWGDWSDWSECSVECDGGTQTRSKKCNNPAPANGGADCEGEDTETRECNTQTCVGKCPSTHPYVYYNGEYCCKTNKEKVHEPQGEKCDGSEIQKDSLCCENDGYAACPADSGLCEGATVDGGWGDWSDWSECSVECDGGTQTRSKKCNNPAPANGGADCEGEDTETRECNTQTCVGKCPSTHPYVYYNGEYCCKTNKEKVHEPQGEKCDGSEIQKDSLCCENDGYAACPADSGLCEGATVDGGWGDWSDWSECSAECDGGTQTRSKKCNNPAPANGGADCEGEDTETRECNTQTCVGKCPSTHPYVYYNGEYCCKTNKEKVHEPQGEKCDGSEIQKDSLCCENDGYAACPADSGLCEGAIVDGGWGDWSDWSECSAECDGGTQTRSKKCNNPAPANGGADCEGEDTETRECNTQKCVGKCPSTHPYVYYNGEYCCKTNKEKVHEPQGEKCDGSEIQRDSLCCENDGYTACPTDECASSAPEANVFRITHTTGTGKYDSGKTSGGYLFTIIGADGETGEHDCPADRSAGTTASCSFKDAAQIGKVTGMRVKNLSDNQWVFVKASVEINGVLRGRWRGSKTIEDYATRAIVFAYIGDEEVEYEITHVTGTGKWDEGARTGQYLFTFKGAGKPFFTDWYDCDAKRTHGATGTCIIRDAAELGKLEKVGIKNLGTNSWTFKKFVVKVNGEVVATWSGTKTVPDKQTVWTVFQ